MNNTLKKAGACVVFLSLNAHAQAQNCEKMPSALINARVEQSTENDSVRLNWQTVSESDSAANAMKQVSKVLATAVNDLKKNQEIMKLQNNIQTFPRYGKDRRISSWQATGTLSFEMKVAALQEKSAFNFDDRITLTGMDYFLSDPKRDALRQELTSKAMSEFQSKADIVAKGFKKAGWTLGEINLNDESGGMPIYAPRAMMGMEMMAAAKSVDVPVAAGDSRVTVSVNGRVCLQP